jgi:hypothetical protein
MNALPTDEELERVRAPMEAPPRPPDTNELAVVLQRLTDGDDAAVVAFCIASLA